MKYRLIKTIETITQNTTVKPDGFSGWEAINMGSDNVTIDGQLLVGVNTDGYSATYNERQIINKTNIQPYVIWDEPIKIIFSNIPSTTKRVVLKKYKYTKLED